MTTGFGSNRGIALKKHNYIIFMFFFFCLSPIFAQAETPDLGSYCEAYPQGKSSPEGKLQLLAGVKGSLSVSAEHAKERLNDVIECFHERRDEPSCKSFRQNLLHVLANRLRAVKMLTAVGEKNTLQLSQLSRNATFNLAIDPELPPELVANFQSSGFTFSANDKASALKIWQRMAIQSLAQEIESKKIQPNANTCQDFMFTPASSMRQSMVSHVNSAKEISLEQNPLLELLKTQPLNEQSLEESLVKLRDYNQKFVDLVKDMRVDHKDTVPSRFLLTMADHEMALVNFPKVAMQNIAKLPENERANACASWAGLEKQQSQRVNSSIGVGFGTALVCGAGIVSGFGTVPALAACLPSIADSLWGGYRGYADAKTARLSQFTGRELSDTGGLSDGLRSREEVKALTRQGNLVAFINFAGIVPVLSGAKAATPGVRGSLKGFAKIPISDSSVSALEMNADKIAGIMQAVKENSEPPLRGTPNGKLVADFQSRCEKILYPPRNSPAKLESEPLPEYTNSAL